MSPTARFATSALALAVSSCALATAVPPSVKVMDVRLTGMNLLQQQLAVTLCVTNPNADELAFRRVTANLDVSGLPLVTGASDQPVRLPPRFSSVVPFTVTTTVQNLGPQLLGVLRTGQVDYRMHGTVTLEGALAFTLPYSRSGQLALLTGGFDLVSAATDVTPPRCARAAG